MSRCVNYVILSDDRRPLLTLYSNNAHPDYDPEHKMAVAASMSRGPTDFLDQLLRERYLTNSHGHRVMDRMFFVAMRPHDHDAVWTIRWRKNGDAVVKLEK